MSKQNKPAKPSFKGAKQSKGKFRGKERYPKGTDERIATQNDFPCIVKEVGKGNDFNWYNRNGNLTTIGASYFLSNPAGKAIGNLWAADGNPVSIVGIATISMLPAFAPTSLDAKKAAISGLNIAAKQLYAKMRKANAGARSQYEAPDLLIYTLAIESIYAFLASCARAYGFLDQYPTMNRYYAKAIIEKMGFDYNDLIKNRLQFLNFINTSIMRLRRFVVPGGFSTVNRSVWVNSNVFVDTTSTVKAQVYIPKYLGYWKYNAKAMATGGCLSIKYIGHTPRTLEQLIEFFEDLIAPIAQDDDFLTISGDIMKFTETYFTLDTIQEGFKLDPLYNEDVMLQLHNLDYLALSNPDSSASWELISDDDRSYPKDMPYNSTYTIYQQDGLLYFQPSIHLGHSGATASSLPTYQKIHETTGDLLYIDTPEDSPSVERVTEATRLLTTYDIESATENYLDVDSCGHEIVVAVELTNDVVTSTINPYENVKVTDTNLVERLVSYTTQLAKLSSFSWDFKLCASAQGNVMTHWNTRSVGTFDKQSFKRLNDIITMSLLTLE